MARSEFGRFYTDDAQQREVRRSLARAKASRPPKSEAPPAQVLERVPKKKATKKPLWSAPAPRHRRTEIADAASRLKAAGKLRKEEV
jgi:hypothetical protein